MLSFIFLSTNSVNLFSALKMFFTSRKCRKDWNNMYTFKYLPSDCCLQFQSPPRPHLYPCRQFHYVLQVFPVVSLKTPTLLSCYTSQNMGNCCNIYNPEKELVTQTQRRQFQHLHLVYLSPLAY